MDLLEHNPTIAEMFQSGKTLRPDGSDLELHSTIDLPTAQAIFNHVLKFRPTVVVEVGMANAGSTLAILTALRCNGQGNLHSIDPNQSTQWQNCGRYAVERAGLNAFHTIHECPDYLALPDLLKSGLAVDFAYIDGWHTFDYALLDFWYLDRMLNLGGHVAFNDCGWPAVEKVIRFMLSHRSYVEIESGLPVRYDRPVGFVDLLRRIKHCRWDGFFRPQQDRYFVKRAAFEPSFDFFAKF